MKVAAVAVDSAAAFPAWASRAMAARFSFLNVLESIQHRFRQGLPP